MAKMALPAMWIRKNMLQSPGPDPGHLHKERKMSENEMRVMRSIQKLSIPDWYLNNNSRPPKILKNDTPIELRPPSWKAMPVKKSDENRPTPVPSKRTTTVSRNGILETEIGPSILNHSYPTFKIHRISPRKKSPPSAKSPGAERKIGKPKPNISRTFPRISPSRKIQNINIVFPPRAKNSECVMVTDLDEPETPIDDEPKGSPDASVALEASSRLDETYSLDEDNLMDNSATKKAQRTPNNALAYIQPWKASPSHSEIKFGVTPKDKFPLASSFKLRASSTPHGSPMSNFTTTELNSVCEEDEGDPERPRIYTTESTAKYGKDDRKRFTKPSARRTALDFDAEANKENRRPPPVSLFQILDEDTPEMKQQRPPMKPVRAAESNSSTYEKSPGLGKLGTATPKPISTPRPIPTPRTSIGPKFLENIASPKVAKSTNTSWSFSTPAIDNKDGSTLFNSSKKSMELEAIVKREQEPREGNSLVRDIIEELNEKCRSSSRSSYTTPGTKNFVKKLVRDLENGVIPQIRYDESPERNDDLPNDNRGVIPEEEAFASSENGSEDEVKSAAVSTSISYKDTDSSDNDPGSPTVKRNYKQYDWNMNIEKKGERPMVDNNNDAKKKNFNHTISVLPSMEKEESDGVYWFPVERWNLPRTSSLFSLNSRSSPSTLGPSVSPIEPANGERLRSSRPTSRTLAWGATYRTKRASSGKLLRINEATVLDSGYSDSARSSRCSYASEICSCYTDRDSPSRASGSTSVGMTRALIHGRPFVV